MTPIQLASEMAHLSGMQEAFEQAFEITSDRVAKKEYLDKIKDIELKLERLRIKERQHREKLEAEAIAKAL